MSWQGPLPPNWRMCPRKAEQLICGKFFAFKTPLDTIFEDQMTEDCVFPPSMVFSSMKVRNFKHSN
jgi:mRNA-capping enzyme